MLTCLSLSLLCALMKIYDMMGLGDVNAIMNIIVIKFCNNIRYWNRASELLDTTLQGFVDLITSPVTVQAKRY